MTCEQCVAFIGGMITSIGGLQSDADRFTAWVDAGGSGFTDPFPPDAPAVDDAEPSADAGDDDASEVGKLTYVSGALRRELMQELQSQALVQPAGPTRQELQQQIRQHEADMRAEPGSERWRAYWTHGGAQQCLAARQALEAAEMPAPQEEQS